MQANATYPSQMLGEELFIVVQDGSAILDIGGKTAEPFRAVAANLKRELDEERRQLMERR